MYTTTALADGAWPNISSPERKDWPHLSSTCLVAFSECKVESGKCERCV